MVPIIPGIVDAVTLALVLVASVFAVRHLIRDAPSSAASRHGVWGRLAVLAVLAGSLVVVWLVGVHLPGRVPGTHCGGGVVAAMGAAGSRALWLRALTVLAALAWWYSQRQDPTGDLSARLLLVLAPMVAMGSRLELQAFRAVAGAAPPCTCGLALAPVAPASPSWPVAVLSALLLLGALVLAWRPPRHWGLSLVLAALTVLWTRLALVFIAADPRHPGGWSLLLPAHHHLGFALFGAVFAATLGGLAPLWVRWLGARLTLSLDVQEAHQRVAAGLLAVGLLVSAGLWAVAT